MDVRFRPITEWPGGKRTPAQRQKDGNKTFGMGYQKTLDSLDRELRKLKARDIVIEADLREDQIRMDGWPRSSEYPRTSGVVVSFNGEHGPLRIPCDFFKRYEHNLRAIALHLERLRLANNYGVGQHGEQYRGWKRLAAPVEAGGMTIESAAEFTCVQIGLLDSTRECVRDPDFFREIYRRAAALLHPDVAGTGNVDKWRLLQEAKSVLDAHHKLAKSQEARG